MLIQLAIRDVVLIEALDIEFGGGLGVLTGETGAGKSILLDALGLALGARADTGLVRSGQSQASVSAEFDLPASHPAWQLLGEAGIASEPAEPLILRRTLKADGGSRAFVNGVAVPAGVLRDLGAAIVEIHGQHDDRGLLNAAGHRALLDAFGRIDTAPCARAWTRLSALHSQIAELKANAAQAEREREWLDHAVAELEQLGPEEGEEARLAEARAMMKQGARVADELEAIDPLIGGGEGALSRLRQAARRLERIAQVHPQLAEALAALDRAIIEAADGEDKLGAAREALSFGPIDLEAAEERLFAIRAVARKHRVEPDELVPMLAELTARREAIGQDSAELGRLERELAAAQVEFSAAALALGEQRRSAAARLDQAVARELEPLRLAAARFRTAIGDAQPGPTGRDRVEFEVATNPGAPFGPLARIASGGELSRFILALKVALAEAGGAGTMIFDEVDRGVGGAVANAIGERLALLASGTQVLVVTHSPQVAARAATHYRIAKASDGIVTRTSVDRLDSDERREEIARMLSGAAVTDEARAQALKLLEAA